jgi:7-cyano-7-deazaguanine synthase
MTPTGNRAVVLASGGLDSTVTAAIAKQDGCELFFLTMAYGQRHAVEVKRARQVAATLGVTNHLVMNLDLRAIGGSALTGPVAMPKGREGKVRSQTIPITYVPGRNLIFLSIAAAHAEVVGASIIYFGANVLDYSGYPDCRLEFIRAFEAAVKEGTKAGTEGNSLHVKAPLLMLSKADIIRQGIELHVPFHLTNSCYDPVEDQACGRCDCCVIRREGFA